MPGRRVCPIRKDQSWIATSDCPMVTSEAASAPAVAPDFLLQGHDREEADDPDDDDAGFEERERDEPERDAFVLALEHREQRDAGPDDGEARRSARGRRPRARRVSLPELTMKPGSLSTGP